LVAARHDYGYSGSRQRKIQGTAAYLNHSLSQVRLSVRSPIGILGEGCFDDIPNGKETLMRWMGKRMGKRDGKKGTLLIKEMKCAVWRRPISPVMARLRRY
jgi:hypothetical protein